MLFLLFLLGLTILHIETPSSAGECTTTSSTAFGLLDIDPVEQEKETWCWAASANVVTSFYKLPDPLSTTTPPEVYSQCRIYNIGNTPSQDCCPNANRSNNSCLQTGWPHKAFDHLTPVINHARPPDGYILWEDVKAEICPNGRPGRPFIFALRPEGGIPHTYTVKGFQEDEDSETYVLFVDSHIKLGDTELGANPMTYGCYQAGECVGAEYKHVRTYYKIHPIDRTPPPAPSNLSVQ